MDSNLATKSLVLLAEKAILTAALEVMATFEGVVSLDGNKLQGSQLQLITDKLPALLTQHLQSNEISYVPDLDNKER